MSVNADSLGTTNHLHAIMLNISTHPASLAQKGWMKRSSGRPSAHMYESAAKRMKRQVFFECHDVQPPLSTHIQMMSSMILPVHL